MADRHINRSALSSAALERERLEASITVDREIDEGRKLIDWKRRGEAEKSLASWLNTYGVGVFVDDPPPPRGVEILNEMEQALRDSRPYQILMARGHGKTSYVEAAAAYAIATGLRKFCVVVSANVSAAKQIVADIYRIVGSDVFAQDYPDICAPIENVKGSFRRKQTFRGKSTDMARNSGMIRFATLEPDAPTSGSVISAAGIASGIRGKKSGTLRPDLVLLDDLQTAEVASNPESVEKLLTIIRKDVLNLGGKGKIATLCTATVIEPDDLAERIASDTAWKTTRFPAMIRWPREFTREDETCLWGQYFKLFDDENRRSASHDRSLSFYRERKAEMDACAEVLNPWRFKESDGQISGIQALMDKMHEIGYSAFMAEYQMQPQRHALAFRLTPKMVLDSVERGLPVGSLIPDSDRVFTCIATDINPSYALSTVVVSFDRDRSGLVAAYAALPVHINDSINDTLYRRNVYDALSEHAAEVSKLGIHVDAWGIDAGGKQFDAVTLFAQRNARQFGTHIVPMLGRASVAFNPNVKSRIKPSLNQTVMCRDEHGRTWLAWDADTYKEIAQKAWGAERGAPGGCSLFDGGVDHGKFADQVAGERLVSKEQSGDRIKYTWKQFGKKHDFGDCMAMCYALAGANNLSGDAAHSSPNMCARRRPRISVI